VHTKRPRTSDLFKIIQLVLGDVMPAREALLPKLQMQYPIIQAPLAGGGDTPELVAAVCNAGGLGFIGAAYLDPTQIRQAAGAVRAKTSRPFGINLFAPHAAPELPASHAVALERLAPYFAELGLPPPTIPSKPHNNFQEQLNAALESGAAIFSFTFGLITPEALTALHERGLLVAGTATTVEEAITLEHAGVDAIVTQSSEAGGHRGTFGVEFEKGMVGTLALVPQVVDAVRVPVIASGGIMDGRGIAAVLALGASAAQLGTAFLTCHESGVPEVYRDAILHAHEDQTRVTRAFSGRPARGIENRFMNEMESPENAAAILPFPLQNALTRLLRTAAVKLNRPEFLSLWAGQGVRLARRQSAADLVARLARETETAIIGLDQRLRSASERSKTTGN
jgi:nitronate monooxygenase